MTELVEIPLERRQLAFYFFPISRPSVAASASLIYKRNGKGSRDGPWQCILESLHNCTALDTCVSATGFDGPWHRCHYFSFPAPWIKSHFWSLTHLPGANQSVTFPKRPSLLDYQISATEAVDEFWNREANCKKLNLYPKKYRCGMVLKHSARSLTR